MLYREINDGFSKHEFEYGEKPRELFINQAAFHELLKTKGLEHHQFSHSNPVSNVFGCPVYVVNMDESIVWLSESDLSSLNKSRNTPLEENWDYIPVTRVNRAEERIQVNIPRVIRDFEYPKT